VPAVENTADNSPKKLSYRYEKKGFDKNTIEESSKDSKPQNSAEENQNNESAANCTEMVEVLLESVEEAPKEKGKYWKILMK
jgi:hypothetical protein